MSDVIRYIWIKPTIIVFILCTYAFIELPLEITDNLLSYLIPFIISIIGLFIGFYNFRFISKINGRYKQFIYSGNIITILIFSFLTIFNFPIPERSGIRCKNWTDIEMLINPNDNSEQYIIQSVEISGSLYSHRQAMVKPINSWLRWHFKTKVNPQSGKWLYIDNSKSGENAVPFPLDNSKINFEKDKSKAIFVTIEKGLIINTPENLLNFHKTKPSLYFINYDSIKKILNKDFNKC